MSARVVPPWRKPSSVTAWRTPAVSTISRRARRAPGAVGAKPTSTVHGGVRPVQPSARTVNCPASSPATATLVAGALPW